MSGVYTAVAVGTAVSYYGSSQAAKAAKNAASAQGDAAGAWLNDIHRQEQEALAKVQTPTQLAAYDQALHGQEQSVRRMETLAQNLDPALIEAGKQTTQLLQGHAAPVMGQIQAQRDLQRKQMLEQLRTQVGPGAETSSIGQQAMQQFDMQTSNMMNEVQQQYLDKVSNLAVGGAQTLGQSLNQVHATLSQIQTQSPGAQAADIMAKFTAAESGAQAAKVDAAGGQYAGDQIMGQAVSNVGGSIMTAGVLRGVTKSLAGAGTAATGAAGAAGALAVTGGALTAANKSVGSGTSMHGMSMHDGASYGSMSSGNLNGAVMPPVAARSAGAGIPGGGSTYNGPLSPNFGMGYSPYPAGSGYKEFDVGSLFGPQTANIAGENR